MKLYTHTENVALCAVCPNLGYSHRWAYDRDKWVVTAVHLLAGVDYFCGAAGVKREVLDKNTIPEWCPLPDVEEVECRD